MHEAQLHDFNCFVTLTYDDDHVGTSLDYSEFQKFMKRLRKRTSVRFFMCGEYGELNLRPHFHMCLFGEAFHGDRYKWRKSPTGNQLYRSPLLESCWTFGNAEFGELTFESAAYVARYALKKVNGDLQDEHYETTDIRTGEIVQRVPEFAHMSTSPGIGCDWVRLYYRDIIGAGGLQLNGDIVGIPKYYKKRLQGMKEFGYIMDDARVNADNVENTDASRLAVREKCTVARVKKSIRSL